MRPFEYSAPTTLVEAIEIAAISNGDGRFLLGGTDLAVSLRHGHAHASHVIDLKRVVELSPRIEIRDGDICFYGGVTMTEIARFLRGLALLPALEDACSVVGSVQIRNRATLIGNICNASPAADTVPVLAATGASVSIFGEKGTRHSLVSDFILGNRRIDLATNEVVTAVRVPHSRSRSGSAFERITRRRGVDLATVNVCCHIEEGGVTTFAFGAASPVPLLVQDDTGRLVSREVDTLKRDRLIEEMTSVANPISDVRASAHYRAEMLKVIAKRAFTRAYTQYSTDVTL